MADTDKPVEELSKHISSRLEVEELADEAAARNPDETTRREALETELLDEDRSEEGEEVGDAIP